MSQKKKHSMKSSRTPTSEISEIDKEIESDPKTEVFLDHLRKINKGAIEQVCDPHSIFKVDPKRPSNLKPESFAAFPDSPTAQRYLTAYNLYAMAFIALKNYTKNSVETQTDCDYLKEVFYGYVAATTTEQHLYFLFRPPETIGDLIEQYLKLCPNDYIAECFKVITVLNPDMKKSDMYEPFEQQKTMIVTTEKYIHKWFKHSSKLSEFDKQLLSSLYYFLAGIYVTTFQEKRALDSFQKCFDINKTNPDALYGIAYQYMYNNQQLAIKHFKEFISMAPVCHKQYPNAHYMLGEIYLSQNNIGEALKYCKLGEDAEKRRLPFMYPVDIPQKETLMLIKKYKPL